MSNCTKQKTMLVGDHIMEDFLGAIVSGSGVSYNIKVKLKVLEFHESSIVTQGFSVQDGYTPEYILFNGRSRDRMFKIIDTMVTPKTAILYLDRNPREYFRSKRCELYLYYSIFTFHQKW